MAEVEKVPAAAATALAVEATMTPAASIPPSAVAQATTPSDIPIGNGAASDSGGRGADNAGSGSSAVEMGTSPTQERSSNSHPHDSEYDTASDLEGGDNYDEDDEELDDDDDEDDEDEDDDEDDDDEDGDSLIDEDDDEELDDDDIESNQPGISIGGGSGGPDKVDPEAQKKVDEDRSNPQYIPKRGTFYEHDDRTGEEDIVAVVGESSEPQDGISCVGGIKPSQSPTIAQASKTMKKWQPASAVERWSHDRFDAGDQAPKSRSELVSAYGYDIRTEDAPPRARRRRRYGRGPSKYLRNWEDETAYLKASNKERKPPRPGDFPALNERGSRMRKPMPTPNSHNEEKENHLNKRHPSDSSLPRSALSFPEERRDLRPDLRGSHNKQQNYGRASGAKVGRQPAMEFKQKQRGGGGQQTPNNSQQHSRQDGQQQQDRRGPNRGHDANGPGERIQSNSNKMMNHSKANEPKAHQAQQYNDSYNNVGSRLTNELPYQQQHAMHVGALPPPQQQQQQLQSPPHQDMPLRQPMPTAKNTATSNLTQRLQQAQNRPETNHVGGAVAHQIGQQQPQPNMMMAQQQAMPVAAGGAHVPQEQRGPTKRYSNLRRTQHEAQHLAEQQHQQQLQQMHMQQQVQAVQQQPPPPQQPIMLQDPHLLQANLMQLYHQENLQAQMQALQVGGQPGAGPAKQPAGYAAVPVAVAGPGAPVPQPYSGPTTAPGAPTAYYVTAAPPPPQQQADAYAAANAQAPPAAQYAPAQPPPNYLPQAQAAPTIAYPNAAAVPSQQAVPVGVPVVGAPSAYGPPPPQPGGVGLPATATAAGAAAGVQPPGAAASNYGNYQTNYNTVGGTTYFVAPPAQATTRPNALPQRRPTNAIPILPPSDKTGKSRTDATKDGGDVKSANAAVSNAANAGNAEVTNAPIGSAENIDHIIDNMFVQRPAFQPPPAVAATPTPPAARKSSSPPIADAHVNSGTTTAQAPASNEAASSGNSTSDATTTATTQTQDEVLQKISIASVEQPGNNKCSASGDSAGGGAAANVGAPIENTNSIINPVAAQE